MFKRLFWKMLSGIGRRLAKLAFVVCVCLVAWYAFLRPSYAPRLNDIIEQGRNVYDGSVYDEDTMTDTRKDSISILRLKEIRNEQEKFYMESR